ncbi:TatD family hydrolase [Halobacillus sp. Marseille-Q1614]|uniref:TatD family hydrolase n=1 Tax=Halobacillus sp. Marseille-Q1614 TaxID=2709134 RepID=UPI0015711CEB|nr:TatD family hydrolase [Halobacillus sp. Marseille-Q1614]
MKRPVIDAHIHLDMYEENSRNKILSSLFKNKIAALITVSSDYRSALRNLQLQKNHRKIKTAIGYHPEQPLPSKKELDQILKLARENKEGITAIGEVGLPYYLRKKDEHVELDDYIKVLAAFIQTAKHLNKPIVLHAIYEDADIVLDLLKNYSIEKAHFHWFKGSDNTLEQIKRTGFYISITPDCLYEKEIQHIISTFPIELMMVETDGPWPFKGKFKDELTHPRMIHDSVKMISEIKSIKLDKVYDILLENTKKFYQC